MHAPRTLALTALLLVGGCAPSEPGAAPDSAAPDAPAPPDAAAPVDIPPPPDAGPPPPPVCTFPQAPRTRYGVEQVYPLLDGFDEPVAMLRTPAVPGFWYVLGRLGHVWRFPDTPTVDEAPLALDLSPIVDASGDSGLLGMAFHPDFASDGSAGAGSVFLSYTRLGGTVMLSRLSRFHSPDGGVTIDPASEEILIEIDQTDTDKLHTNGAIRFGPDGLLYVAFGDGGPDGDPDGHAQNPFSLQGKLLRLDVDSASPYATPPDNPFAEGGGAPEVYSLGLRNPWQWHLDPPTGDIFAGDVGWSTFEELNRLVAGGNYGWPLLEGSLCHAEGCDALAFIAPVAQYDHLEGRAITGGPVYRGALFAELVGHVLIGDFINGYVWAVDPDSGARQLLADTGLSIVSFATDAAGEVYLVDLIAATLHALRPREPAAPLPTLLSETGCVAADDPKQPAEGLVAYEVASALWSDGAIKQRWLTVPGGASASWSDDGHLDLPPGSVLLKTFDLQAPGAPRVETRLLARHADGRWAGYTYAWDDAQEDATLVPLSSLPEARTIAGEPWQLPTRQQCRGCHTPQAGHTLGLAARQLNLLTDVGPQVASLVAAGVAPPPPDLPPAMPSALDTSAPLDTRARAYLHANCAHCHRPGTPIFSPMDLRFDTALADAGICGVDGWTGGGVLLTPGDPLSSQLVTRTQDLGPARMPPFGSSVVDTAGVALLTTWIEQLEVCP